MKCAVTYCAGKTRASIRLRMCVKTDTNENLTPQTACQARFLPSHVCQTGHTWEGLFRWDGNAHASLPWHDACRTPWHDACSLKKCASHR